MGELSAIGVDLAKNVFQAMGRMHPAPGKAPTSIIA